MIEFDYYKNKYNGNLSDKDFPRFELEASSFIRYYTANKVDSELDGRHSEVIKLTVCKLIDILKAKQEALNSLEKGLEISRNGIASESVTDHSVSFKKVSESTQNDLEETYKNKLVRTIRENLMWTGLLYRGL